MKKIPKLFIGPMSINIIDSILSLDNYYKDKVGFILSRRQIEFDSGYVNNFTTKQFYNYVNNKVVLERDHGGPNQGKFEDDGIESYKQDSKYMDIIHIDPWKKYNNFEDGVESTIKLINFIYKINKKCLFEIGTEQSIRQFSCDELDKFICYLKNNLSKNIFSKIIFLVIQSGTSLKGNKNIGIYDENKLKEMIGISKKYNLLSKEHNGDYLGEIIKNKFNLGLDAINIAPEFGFIETNVILDIINKNNDNEFFDIFFDLCYKSGKWKKWVDCNFDPKKNKEELIKISGHYIFSDEKFIKYKSKYEDIDLKIKSVISDKIKKIIKDIYKG